MSTVQALILGLLQGLTEFLPVSSSGHLVLVPWLLRWEIPTVAFDTTLHLGTLLALVFYLRRDLAWLFQGWWQGLRGRNEHRVEGRLAWLLLASTLPAGLVGYLLGSRIERLFQEPRVVALFLLVTGTVLLVSERVGRRVRDLAGVRLGDVLLVSLAQALAIAPGISRSGATITTGLLCGLRREAATRFSALMGIPIIAGAAVLKLSQVLRAAPDSSLSTNLAIGFAAATLSGYLGIRFLLNYVRDHNLYPFSIYCFSFSLFCLIISFLR